MCLLLLHSLRVQSGVRVYVKLEMRVMATSAAFHLVSMCVPESVLTAKAEAKLSSPSAPLQLNGGGVDLGI